MRSAYDHSTKLPRLQQSISNIQLAFTLRLRSAVGEHTGAVEAITAAAGASAAAADKLWSKALVGCQAHFG